MARSARRFTAKQVAAMAKPGRYCDGHRLWLQVRNEDHKSWLLRFTSPVTLKARTMGLGDAFQISLAEARERADEANKLIRQGRDPLEEQAAAMRAKKEAALKAVGTTFKRAAEDYLAAHASTWKNEKHRAQWPSTLQTYAFPIIGNSPVAAIETDHILKILKPIWNTKRETASRLRGRLETVLDYAATHGWRSGENPARWRGHLENVLPSKGKDVEHHAAMPWKEVPAFMQGKLAAEEGAAAMALRFAILTACRTGEVIGATWQEIDENDKVWTIPAHRMKAGKEHRVPLSDQAIEVLRQAAELGRDPEAPVFPGRKAGQPLSNMALLMLLRRLGRGDLTAHGFRSCFRDWAAETTDHHPHVVEMALAHSIGNAVEAAYRRGDLFDKRRALMDDWASFLSKKAKASA